MTLGHLCQGRGPSWNCDSPKITAEFIRVSTTDRLVTFLDGLAGLVPRLLDVYKATSGKKQALKDIWTALRQMSVEELMSVTCSTI
ncbi:hypothetical protein DPEC_G00047130 [Dallia pectoralis]|uniref:Uncharacterized protein n=1 Tax=Dallia pectoralis TaxID=75939 RepID=A0ACC2HBE0_DALPE|nr:hypothetical protein DPEC_G00047130 [Dallia pectoralis]